MYSFDKFLGLADVLTVYTILYKPVYKPKL